MDIMALLGDTCRRNNRKVIFPEGEERNIIQAAHKASKNGICRPWLIGERQVITGVCHSLGIDEEGWYECSLPEEDELEKYVDVLCTDKMDKLTVQFLLEQPLYYASMMVRAQRADAMVAGLVTESGEVVSAGTMIVGLAEGVSAPSSYFLFEIPTFYGSEGNMLVYADGGVQIEPDAEHLAEIAVLTAVNIEKLLGWQPRVALLSFSTKGSAEHARTEKVKKALEIAKEKAPWLTIDGEMQGDAALCPEVAAKKIPSGSPVAGRANILIFPDLDAGNISYKLTQRLTGATAYGPILQGFKRPVFDLSRGSSSEDILGVICIASAQ